MPQPVETSGLSRSTRSFGIALVLASLVNSLLVVLKEKSPTLQAEMKKLTGHHWITHCVVVITLFLVSGWFFSRLHQGEGPRLNPDKLIATLVSGITLAGAIILGFYLLAD